MNSNSFKTIIIGALRKSVLYLMNFFWVLLIIFLFYFFPKTAVVQLVGTEVKRMDQKLFFGEELRDVRFIITREEQTGKTKSFRNQDVVFPPYFKFDSGDLTARVMTLEQYQSDDKVAITYYGFRLPIFSMYPNATKVELVSKKTPPDYTYYIGLAVSVLLFIAYLVFYMKIRKALPKNHNT